MGIKHYFAWFKNQFSENIHRMKKGQDFVDINVDIDTLMIDMNGVFHNSAQKIYQYGNYKPRQHPRILGKTKVHPRPQGAKAQIMMFEDVCRSVDAIFKLVKPNKSLVLCVDGPAPLGKQCIAAGTRITLSNGTSCAIENIKKDDKVLGWNGEGFTSTPNLGLQIKGEKETIKLTFIDGRNLVCTLDHPILVMMKKKAVWKQAGNLQKGEVVVAGLDSPLDILGDDEKDWVLNFGDTQLTMTEDRKKLLILSRIIGYVLSDGYINVTPKTMCYALIMTTRIDAELCVEDICILTGKIPIITKTNGVKGTVYIVELPREWTKLLSELPGMPLSKDMTIPDFLLREDCPLSLIREFVAGLFGYNAHAPRLNFKRNGNSNITPVKFSQNISEKYLPSFLKYMDQICRFLEKLGVSGTTVLGPEPHEGDYIKSKNTDKNPYIKYSLQLPMNTDFGDKVGYRYAHNKSLRLTIASSYWGLCKKISRQEEEIITLAIKIYDNQVINYKFYCETFSTHRNSMKIHNSYRYFRNTKMNISPSRYTMEMALQKAINEYKQNNVIFHHTSIPNLEKIYNTSMCPRNSLDALEFLDMTNTGSWFKLHCYPYEQEDQQLPMYTCPILDICSNGNLPVYDIEVIKNHSFLANGLCVHNCQQRQRRFRSALEQEDNSPFNSNCITPGTKFMDYLTKYMDWYIRKRISEDEEWQKVQVIFSNEKVPGEGEAKCFLQGTNILMWDGIIKYVENIEIGDSVIGDDGKPRTVTELVSGEDDMYEIEQNNGINYTVNKYHILTLEITDHKNIYWDDKEGFWLVSWFDRNINRYKHKYFTGLYENEAYMEAIEFLDTIPNDNIIDISVVDYLALPLNIQKRLYGFKCSGVYWPKRNVEIDPYLLGLCLGYEDCRDPNIFTIDEEIIQYLKEYCDNRHYKSCIMSILKKYNLIENKYIPRDFIVNDYETRLKVLAGIIDSERNIVQNNRIICITLYEKHKQLFEDIVYLAKSLGFCVNFRKIISTYICSQEKYDNCYQITISGDIHKIPLILRKNFEHPIPKENGRKILRTSIKVKHIGKDTYYGFNTDGNHRFLLGDFTVVHNCMSYVRQFGSIEEKYCIYGLDADLIMLSLATHKPNFHVLRDDLYDVGNEFYCIDIGATRHGLANILRWNEGKHVFNEINGINDFIFMCFIVGNDFLPHIPSIEIIEGGIDLMIEIYKDVGISYGHLTKVLDGKVQLRIKQLSVFLGTIGQHEKENFESKLARKKSFFPDPLLESCSTQIEGGKWNIDIEKYKQDYLTTFFPTETIEEKLCHDYIEGMQWVLSYYTSGVPNWKWYFPYHYAPPASIIVKHTLSFKFPDYPRTISTTPFQQLLCVLPPKSANLIPYPLCRLLTDESSPLRKFSPEKFEIDLSGKRREWEGIVILPMVDFNLVRECYMDRIEQIDEREMKRNKLGRTFIYNYSPEFPIIFSSYYGDIEKCCVSSIPIDI